MSKGFFSSWDQTSFTLFKFSFIFIFFIKSFVVGTKTFLGSMTNHGWIAILKEVGNDYKLLYIIFHTLGIKIREQCNLGKPQWLNWINVLDFFCWENSVWMRGLRIEKKLNKIIFTALSFPTLALCIFFAIIFLKYCIWLSDGVG